MKITYADEVTYNAICENLKFIFDRMLKNGAINFPKIEIIKLDGFEIYFEEHEDISAAFVNFKNLVYESMEF